MLFFKLSNVSTNALNPGLLCTNAVLHLYSIFVKDFHLRGIKYKSKAIPVTGRESP
jgi:hypothetical protein